MNHILHIDASGRNTSSVSRQLSKEIIDKVSDGKRNLEGCHVLNFEFDYD